MRSPDLLIMGINNLRRGKLRAVLIVLGVIIGTASIVVMVSLGIGLDQMFIEQLSSWGSLTTVDVYGDSESSYYGGAAMVGGGGSKSSDPAYITDEMVDKFQRIGHVTGVSPILDMNVVIRQGVYEAQYMTLRGVGQKLLEQIPLGEGCMPEPEEMGLVFGNTVQQDFYNSRTGRGYWDTGELPDVDFLNRPLFVIFDMDAYFQSKNTPSSFGSSSDDSQPQVKPPKKYVMNGIGKVGDGPEDWNSYSYGVYMDIDSLKVQLKKAFKKGTAIPGQSTNEKGKPPNYLVYNRVQIYVDDMENVKEIQSKVADMGFQVNNQMDWIESSKQQSQMTQAMLGGIGAVSLLAATIGIVNTMMMPICERTKRIGVMKVLGCDIGNIRNMFLIESGFVGFMGGMIGIGLSYGISGVISRFVNMEEMNGLTGNLSRVPPWLSLAAARFAIFVGMAAGLMPAMGAMKLSPLTAIRSDQ